MELWQYQKPIVAYRDDFHVWDHISDQLLCCFPIREQRPTQNPVVLSISLSFYKLNENNNSDLIHSIELCKYLYEQKWIKRLL